MPDTQMRPFSIKIFLPDGVPDGLRIIEKSNWTGCGVVCPRSMLGRHKVRDEFSKTGVYVVVGPSEEANLPCVYVGEGDPVRSRLEQHAANKDFWTWLVFFVSKDESLNKAHVKYLEARLVDLAQKAKRSTLENQATPQRPTLSEAERADVESFLADMLSIFPLLGLHAFEEAPPTRGRRDLLEIKSKGISAKGYDTGSGFVVVKNSGAVADEVPSIVPYLTNLRRELLSRGVLAVDGKQWRMTQDYVFNSPSTAAGVILGRSANGRIEWKDKKGRPLRELQKAESDVDATEV